MHAFHFGRQDEPLYGAYSPPDSGGQPRRAVLLCYPFGQEQTRAHMAFRQLANLVGRRGGGVLRFDYYGTGDSWGSLEDADFGVWVTNAELALEELKALSGAHSVTLVGLRLGAMVAARVAQARDDVDGLVLWDPVVRGDSFLSEMESCRSEVVDGSWWVFGYPLGRALRLSLEDVCLPDFAPPGRGRLCQAQSYEAEAFDGYWDIIKDHPGGADKIVVPGQGDWNYVDNQGGILLPHGLVSEIAEWVMQSG